MTPHEARAISIGLATTLKLDRYRADWDLFAREPVETQRDLLAHLVLVQNREWLHLHHRLDKVLSQLRKRGIKLRRTP